MGSQTVCSRWYQVTLVVFVQLFSTVRFQMCSQIACLRGCIITLVAFVWLFPTVCSHVCPQIACFRGGIGTLVAFIWLFSTMGLQMSPQIARISGCIITLVAFVQLFSAVRLQMCPQTACLRGRKITLVAFVWLVSSVSFKMFPQTTCIKGCIIALVTFYFMLLCLIECVFKLSSREDANSHWLHLLGFSPLCIFKWLLKWPSEKMYSCTGCICLTLFSGVFSNVLSICLLKKFHSFGRIYLTPLMLAFFILCMISTYSSFIPKAWFFKIAQFVLLCLMVALN